MDGRRWNPESNLEDQSVEPSSERRNSREEEDLLFLLGNNNNNITAEEEEEEDGADWSQVLEEILELITARLHIGDRIQTSRLCKRWRSIVVRSSHPISSYGSPCLLRIFDDQRGTRFMLTDHFRNEHYTIDISSLPTGILIAHSNNGWLLLVKHCIGYVAIFFFNPLTQATVELPKLPRDLLYMFGFWLEPTSSSGRFYMFGFWSDPTSDQCRVIAKPTGAFENNSTSFFSWVPGAKEWEFFAIDHQESSNFEAANHKPFLIHDRIYYLDSRGRRVGIYNLSDNKLTVIGGELPIQVVPYRHFVYYNFVKMDDKIIFIYTEEEEDNKRIHLYELDESKQQQQLIKLESTRGRSLFCCNGNCIFAEPPIGTNDESAWDLPFKNEIVVMSRACIMNKPQTVRTFEEAFLSANLPWTNACWTDLKP